MMSRGATIVQGRTRAGGRHARRRALRLSIVLVTRSDRVHSLITGAESPGRKLTTMTAATHIISAPAYVTDHVTNLVRLYQPSDRQADAYMGLTVRVAKQVRDQSFVAECGTIRGAKPYVEQCLHGDTDVWGFWIATSRLQG